MAVLKKTVKNIYKAMTGFLIIEKLWLYSKHENRKSVVNGIGGHDG